MEYYSAIRKDKILPVVIAWMDLENIMLREISGRKSQEPYNLIQMWGYTRSVLENCSHC